jgi:hypothetical protein
MQQMMSQTSTESFMKSGKKRGPLPRQGSKKATPRVPLLNIMEDVNEDEQSPITVVN